MGFRSRKVEMIVYQENLKDVQVLENYLKSTGNLYFISPLHDKDVYADGDKKNEIKKPHWHILLCFQNARFFNSVAKEFATFGVIEQNLNSVKNLNSAVRYLCHLDEKDKAKYELKDLRTNAKDLQKYLKAKQDKFSQAEISGILLTKLEETKILRFSELVDIAKSLGDDFVNFVTMRAYFFTQYLRERRMYNSQRKECLQSMIDELQGKDKEKRENELLEIF